MPDRMGLMTELEVNTRMRQLAELKSALATLGVESVLARNHRLILRYNNAPLEQSGLTDPQLHIFVADGKHVATADGAAYRLDHGGEFSAENAATAARLIFAAVTLTQPNYPQRPLRSRSQPERNHSRD
jgi:hypothetical protein